MTHFQEIFVSNLRFYRKEKGFTQLAFSEAVGLSPNYLNAVEKGKNFPSPEVIQKITEELQIMPYELFLEIPLREMEKKLQKEKKTIEEIKAKILNILEEYK